MKKIFSSIDIAKQPKPLLKTQFYECPIFSIDTEYTATEDGKSNRIISYQLFILFNNKSTSLIIYTQSGRQKDRIKFDTLLTKGIEQAYSEGVLSEWPSDVIMCAHFLRADLLTFSKAFEEFKTKVSGIRKTVASLKGAYGVDLSHVMAKSVSGNFDLWDSSRNQHQVNITFYDTMLLAPNGKSLADVGKLVDLPKLDIPEPYSIERMDEYLEADKTGFEAYAIRDAEISAYHMKRMMDFCQDLGLKSVPFTIGSLAVKSFINSLAEDYRDAFGFIQQTKEVWPEGKARPITRTFNEPDPERETFEMFATRSYHGGRNESFIAGITPESTWNDFDAPSCYTAILVGLRQIDYSAILLSYKVEDFFGDICSMARVSFKFPDDTRFPSLPVRADSYGLIYPLEGETYCTGHELEVAHGQGAEIEILQGIICPWVNDERIFEPFMANVRKNRNDNEKGSFEERLHKEIGNSVYGKLAQGLRKKSAFDTTTGLSKDLPPSSITNPFFAAYTTGLARALMSAMLNAIPAEYSVVSVTTDGFLTDAPLEAIDLTGSICQRFREHYHRIQPDGGEILELKHQAKQIVSMKTRGQLTALAIEGQPIVLAKAGIKAPRGTDDQNAYMVDLYLNRFAGQKVDASHLTSIREQFLEQKDLVTVVKEQRLNLEFDFKRMPVEPYMQPIYKQSHFAAMTTPHQSVKDMEFIRLRFDNWRKNSCLKTLDDWEMLDDRLAMELCKPEGIRLNKDETSDQLLVRIFVRFYKHDEAGLCSKDMDSTELSEWFDSIGYTIKPNTITAAKRSKLVFNAVPRTPRVMALIDTLKVKFSGFDAEILLVDN